MSPILAIARRELDGYFATPLGWIVLTAFLAITGFFFAFGLYEFQEVSIQAAAMPYGQGAPTVNDWLLPAIFGNWAIILLLVVPGLTMRLFAEDVRQRSFELLLSSPVSSAQIVLGKYLGVVGFLSVLFGLTLYQVGVLYWLGSPDPGIVAASYGAMLALALVFGAVGMFASSLTDNQLVAFMISFAALLMLFILGWFQDEEGFTGALGALSMLSHIEELMKGLLHLEDLVYFVSFIGLMIFATQQRVESFRWSSGLGGSSRGAADAAIDVAAGFGLLLVISKVVRLLVSGSNGIAEGAGNLIWLALVSVGAVAMGVWLWRNRAQLKQGVEARGTRLLVGSLALVSMAVGLTVAANILASRYDKRWDITASQRFGLSPQTVKALDALPGEVELLAFFDRAGLEGDAFRTLVEGYAAHSPKLKVRFIDPQEDPLVAREYEVTNGYGTAVLKLGERSQRLTEGFDEEGLTNALLRLSSTRRHRVCASIGHEELDPEDTTTTVGLGSVAQRMLALNYDLAPLALAREGRVPPDCEVLLIAGPQVDLLPAEREMVAAYVVNGGQVFILMDPLHAPETALDLSRYGVEVGDDLVLEANPNFQVAGGDISYLVLSEASFDFHPITEPLKGGALLRIARSVGRMEGAAGVRTQALAHTTAYGWGERDYADVANIAPDLSVDRAGPVPLMVVSEITDPAALVVGDTRLGQGGYTMGATPPEGEPTEAAPAELPRKEGGRVVVVGDTDFAANELVDQLQNADLFLNTIAWLVGEDSQVSIRSTEASRGSLEMNGLQFLMVALAALLFVPGIALVAAVGTWRSRQGR